MRPHEFEKWALGRHDGQTALLVGGGASGSEWPDVYASQKPDIILGVNGVVPSMSSVLDYSLFIDPAAPGQFHRFPWFAAKLTKPGATRLVHPNVLAFGPRQPDNTVEVLRSWHTGGFDPHRYVNPKPVGNMTPYAKYCTTEGLVDAKEVGLLKGPVTAGTGMKFSVGTCFLQLLHLCALFHVKRVHAVGFEFCFNGGPHHWYGGEDYPATPAENGQPGEFRVAVDSEQHIKVNDLPTLWIFAQSAAYSKKMLPVMGYEFVNHSGGLLDLPHIESLLEHINGPAKDCYV